jgi:hypothetical protein
MTFKSQAQRRKFAQLLVEGKISNETFEEWNRQTGSKKLPERVARKTRATTISRGQAAPVCRQGSRRLYAACAQGGTRRAEAAAHCKMSIRRSPQHQDVPWGAGITADEMDEMQWVKPKLLAQIRYALRVSRRVRKDPAY